MAPCSAPVQPASAASQCSQPGQPASAASQCSQPVQPATGANQSSQAEQSQFFLMLRHCLWFPALSAIRSRRNCLLDGRFGARNGDDSENPPGLVGGTDCCARTSAGGRARRRALRPVVSPGPRARRALPPDLGRSGGRAGAVGSRTNKLQAADFLGADDKALRQPAFPLFLRPFRFAVTDDYCIPGGSSRGILAAVVMSR